MTVPVRGAAALSAGIIVAVTLVWLPGNRWFHLVSIGLGTVIAGGFLP